VFATTNVRTSVRFSVCGELAGGEVQGTSPRSIRLEVHGARPLLRADIVRNGSDLITMPLQGCDLLYEGEDPVGAGEDWYYARLTHEDGEMAWSSPVWVRP
jgi:hypothetical protein